MVLAKGVHKLKINLAAVVAHEQDVTKNDQRQWSV